MNKDYSKYLENLKKRRYDEVIKESILSEGFHKSDFPPAVTYVLESMKEIDPSYSYKLYNSFRRTQDLITQNLKRRNIPIDVRYHGPHSTETHIELYGDLELLVILKQFSNQPSKDILTLAMDIVDILTSAQAYNLIDFSNRNRCFIQTRKPISNISILPALWVDSATYRQTSLEINRGICEFNFEKKTRKIYLPFLNMARLNARDKKSHGIIKSLIRLIRSVIADNEQPIDLTYEEIVGIVYNMPLRDITVPATHYPGTVPKLLSFIELIIKEQDFRERMLSPSKKEFVFGKRQKTNALRQLRDELAAIIQDMRESLREQNKSLHQSFEY